MRENLYTFLSSTFPKDKAFLSSPFHRKLQIVALVNLKRLTLKGRDNKSIAGIEWCTKGLVSFSLLSSLLPSNISGFSLGPLN